MYSSETSRWNAIQTKDPNADGVFLYAVKSTRIYCRPVCKARLPRRANVQFYETCQAAQDAGYRACKRCKPQDTGVMPLEHGAERVRQLLYELTTQKTPSCDNSSRQQELTLAEMAARSGLSKWHFHRVFKKIAGVTPQRFLEMRSQSQKNDTDTSLIPSTSLSPEMGAPLLSETDSPLHSLPITPALDPLLFHDFMALQTFDAPVLSNWPPLEHLLFDPESTEPTFASSLYEPFCDF